MLGFALLVTIGSAIAPLLVETRSAGRPNHVIWITWDSVRADHTSAYGYERATTPNLQDLASDGVLFETAISQHNWTLPSYVSIMSSRPCWKPRDGIPARSTTLVDPTQLAEVLFQAANPLLERAADGRRFRLIGVGASDLGDEELADPPQLLDPGRERRAEVERAIDAVRAKLGDDSIRKGRALGYQPKPSPKRA